MPRTTARSSRSSSHGARRTSSARSRSTRSHRRVQPRLTQRQVREIGGILLLLIGLLGLLAAASNQGSILAGIREWLLGSFGRAWFVPVAASLGTGAYLLWPNAPRPRPLDVISGLVAVFSLIGLFGMARAQGGGLGAGIDQALTEVVGTFGAWALLVAGLVIGLIVTIHFSPGAVIQSVLDAVKAALNERDRLERLVKLPEQPKAVPLKAANGAAAAVGPAYPPVPTAPHPWEIDNDPEPQPKREPVRGEREPKQEPDMSEPKPVLRVVAEPEDDLPEIEWKLPSVAMLDTVTARRERMKDEIKRNAVIIEQTLETFGVPAKVVGVNTGPAVTQFEVQPGPGVQVKKITALQNDLSLALAAAPLRIEAPIPGKSAVGIEVPNKAASLVTIREVLETAAFREGTHSLALALGNDVSGASIVGDLTRMPHLLIAGATGQGKSEELICRIAQLARAVGIHLVIATQRPSTDIITGLIKANIPSRIAFAVGSQVDSRVILDTSGAEKLLGRGDMLYQPVDAGKPTRIQGAFVSDQEVDGVVNFWKSQGGPRYMEEILEEGAVSEWEGERREERKLDPLFARSARAVAAEGAASVSLVQRKFNVGYSRAGRIVDQLAEHRVVGGYQGSKSREVLMTLPDVDELLERLGIE